MRLVPLVLGALASLATHALVLDLAADASAVQDALATPYDYIVVGGGTGALARSRPPRLFPASRSSI